MKLQCRMFILVVAMTFLLLIESSKIPERGFPNSKFLDPQLSDEENLYLLSNGDTVNITQDIVNRDARNADERGVKTFGFLTPMFGMLGSMNPSTNSYSSQYNIPGSTQLTNTGYTVPLYNYPFYNYFFSRGQGRTQN